MSAEDKVEATSQREAVEANAFDPEKKYLLVTCETGVTGYKLIDELVNLGSYVTINEEAKEFVEYIMPYGKLGASGVRNYGLRIIDTGRFRIMKEIKSNKVLKTKSEVAAFNEWIQWLNQIKGDHDGIVLAFLEQRHAKMLQLVQALERYRLLEDFKKTVVGFVNAGKLLPPKDEQQNHQSLRALVEQHIGPNTHLESALQRAQAVYSVMMKVNEGNVQNSKLQELLVKTDDLLSEMHTFKEELLKEAQWRPVFADMFRDGMKQRRRAAQLRRILVDSGVVYQDAKKHYAEDATNGVKNYLKDHVKEEQDLEELTELLNKHLAAPEKRPRRNSRGPRTRSLCAADRQKQAASAKGLADKNNNSHLKATVTFAEAP